MERVFVEEYYQVFVTTKRKYWQSSRPDSQHCWPQCNNVMADHSDIFWRCQANQAYWSEIIRKIKSIMGLEMDCSFITIYLDAALKTHNKYFLKILRAPGKKANEKKKNGKWINIVKDLYNTERMTSSLRLLREKRIENNLMHLFFVLLSPTDRWNKTLFNCKIWVQEGQKPSHPPILLSKIQNDASIIHHHALVLCI